MSGALAGKSAVVTGGNRGIGLALACALLNEGCRVAIAARDQQRLEQAASALAGIGPEVVPLPLDVREPASVEAAFAAVRARFGGLDFLLNNAGIAQPLASVEKLTLESWRAVMDTNLTGTFLCTRAALPMMRRGGAVVNLASMSALQHFRDFSAYNASKAGVVAFTATLREELRERGIRAIAVLPGATATDIWQQFWPEAERGRMVPPESVAAMVVEALKQPPTASVDEIRVTPAGGAL